MRKEQFKFLESAIGKDEARKPLMFLEFNVANNMCIVRAANAFIIKQIKVYTGIDEIEGGLYYLAGKQITKLLKISTNADEINLTSEGALVDGVLLKWFDEDFNYPRLDNLIDGSYGTVDKVLGFNTKYMGMALKDAPNEVFKMEFKQDSSSDNCLTAPTRITFAGCPEYLVIIIPVRIQW